MKKLFIFKTIYAKFAVIFLGIWWFLNILTFTVVNRILVGSRLERLSINKHELISEFHRVRMVTSLTFLISSIVGTIIILLVVRSIVKPIKRLSKASREVAKGNFEVNVKAESQDEIGMLISDFNLMAKELKNIELLRKDFVSNVSHEFKTPITSIKGFAKLIRDANLSSDQVEEYSDIIVGESERLSVLSSNLLKLSELDSKVILDRAENFFLDEQIRKTVLILENEWTRKNIEFEIDMEKTLYNGDENLLQQVWLNLLQNAIKFSKDNGLIKIRLFKDKTSVRVEVEDNGIGISAEDQKRIFERFYKGDKSRSRDGNGLGLAIVKKIVEMSNGRIYLKSTLGEGSIFIVELPINT